MVRSNLKSFSQIAQHVEESKPQETSHRIDREVHSLTRGDREQKALAILKNNMLWSMGIGAIPVPFLSLVSTTVFQLKMLQEMSLLYDIPFSRHKAKNLIGSLVCGVGSLYAAKGLVHTAFAIVPGIGMLTYLTAIPLMSGAATYATGKVFIQHFESGGTFLTFDPQRVRSFYREEFENGLTLSAQLKKQK